MGTWGCCHWDRSVGCGCFLVRLTFYSEQSWRPHATEWGMQFLCRDTQFVFRFINIQLSSKSPRNFVFISCLETVLLYSTGCLQTCDPPASVLPVLKLQVYVALLSKTDFDLSAWLTSFLLVFWAVGCSKFKGKVRETISKQSKNCRKYLMSLSIKIMLTTMSYLSIPARMTSIKKKKVGDGVEELVCCW